MQLRPTRDTAAGSILAKLEIGETVENLSVGIMQGGGVEALVQGLDWEEADRGAVILQVALTTRTKDGRKHQWLNHRRSSAEKSAACSPQLQLP